MKTNQHFALLYDDNCPLCVAYTKLFVTTGLVSAQNRIAFSTADLNVFKLDIKRAKHEIPLVDLQTGKVIYGIDALAEILNQRLPFVKPVLGIAPVNRMFRKLYRFISYNRKVIVANPLRTAACFDCSPDFNLPLRLSMALLTYVLAAVIAIATGSPLLLIEYCAWLALAMVVSGAVRAIRGIRQSADILVHAGISLLLSVLVQIISVKIFSLLFTSPLLITVLSLVPAMVVLIQQSARRIRSWRNEYMA